MSHIPNVLGVYDRIRLKKKKKKLINKNNFIILRKKSDLDYWSDLNKCVFMSLIVQLKNTCAPFPEIKTNEKIMLWSVQKK